MNIETALLISLMVGNKTVKEHSLNKPNFLDLNPGSRSVHESETQRALLLPQEVMSLPRDQQILLIESAPPIKSRKIFYFKDPFFTNRLLPPIDFPTQEPYDPRKHSGDEAVENQGGAEQVEDPNAVPENIDEYVNDPESLNPEGAQLPGQDAHGDVDMHVDVDIDMHVEPEVPVELAAERGFGEFKLDGFDMAPQPAEPADADEEEEFEGIEQHYEEQEVPVTPDEEHDMIDEYASFDEDADAEAHASTEAAQPNMNEPDYDEVDVFEPDSSIDEFMDDDDVNDDKEPRSFII